MTGPGHESSPSGAAASQMPRVIHLQETTSTNDHLRELAQSGAEHGTAVFAESQTRGRGRRGRHWVSPPGLNLLFSVLLRPVLSPEKWSRYPHAAGLAVALAVEEIARLEATVKWPNDVLLSGKKIAGILLESDPKAGFAIIGIGVNVNALPDNFPEELRSELTSLRAATEGQHAFDRESVANTLLTHLATQTDRAVTDFSGILTDIQSRSAIFGKQVRAQLQSGTLIGQAIAFGPEGELHIQDETERIHELTSVEQLRVVK